VRPTDVVADGFKKLLDEKSYQELDASFDKYLKEETATADGISALAGFYKGISQSFDVCAHPKRPDGEWLAHRDALLAWSHSSPKSIAAKFALALFAIDYGWYGRGDGYASKVDDTSQQLFKDRMADAKHQLDELAGIGKNIPTWYSGMLEVGTALGWKPEKINDLYEKAIRLDPYYVDIHFAVAEYYSAKWHGSQEQMLTAIERSANLTQQRLGQSLYARLHTTQSSSAAMFETGGVSWERMKTGFNDYLRIYPDDRTRNKFAIYSCMANDAKSTKQQLELLGPHVDPQMWESEHYAYCVALAKNSESGKKPQCFRSVRTGEVVCN
jgi:hypothetical protein